MMTDENPTNKNLEHKKKSMRKKIQLTVLMPGGAIGPRYVFELLLK
jgi:hypothetical protein